MNGSPSDTWHHKKLLIFIERWTLHRAIDLHQTAAASWSKAIKIGRLTWSTSDVSRDSHRTTDRTRGRTPRSWHDRTTITVRSSRDRAPFSVESERREGIIPLSCSSTFDQFVKELSEFRGRSLVHRDPPAFRLNSEGIGAGLITNSSLISSNFSLEFRKSVRKDPSKFTPIRANWSLILVAIGLVVRFDRLSRGNLSFY